MDKTLQVYRSSGRPVNLEDYMIYMEDWRLFYDKAAARAGLDMRKMHRFLQYGEKALARKHEKKVTVNEFADIRKLIMETGCNALIGVSSENEELIIILQDT